MNLQLANGKTLDEAVNIMASDIGIEDQARDLGVSVTRARHIKSALIAMGAIAARSVGPPTRSLPCTRTVGTKGALVLSRYALEAIGAKPGSAVNVSLNGNSLVVEAAF